MIRASMSVLALWMLGAGPMPAVAQMPGVEGGSAAQRPFGHMNGHMWGWHWGWWLLWLLVAVAIIWALVRATHSGRGGPEGPAQESSEDALRRRYAAGEITREEFEERLNVLRESR